MPLLQPQLEIAIRVALEKAQSKDSPTSGNAALAKELAKAIHLYTVAATVNPGQLVVTAGTAVAQAGSTTTPGSLS